MNKSKFAAVLCTFLILVSLLFQRVQAQETSTEWLADNTELKFVVLNNHYPYSFIDEAGHVSGMVTDYARLFGQQTGVNTSFVIVESHKQANQALLDGRADVFPFQAYNKDIPSEFRLSDTYLPFQLSLIHLDGLENSSESDSLKIALINGAQEPEQSGRWLSGAEFIKYDTAIDALRDIEQGAIDAVITEPVSGMELANRSGINGLSVSYKSKSWRAAKASMKVRKNNTGLSELIDEVLSAVTPEQQNEIASTWLNFSPYRPRISGIVSFGGPPYRYPQSPTMGIEHELLQTVFNQMGFLLGDLKRLPAESAKKTMSSSSGISFYSGVRNEIHSGFIGEPLLEITYVPISLVSRDLVLERMDEINVGALQYEEGSLSYQVKEKVSQSLVISKVVYLDDLEAGVSLLKSQDIDVVLVERRVLDWFLAKTGFIEKSELRQHSEHVVVFPVYVEFTEEQIKERFDAAVQSLRQKEELTSIIEKHTRIDLNNVATKAGMIGQVVAYFAVNDRMSEVPEVLSLFDAEHIFSIVNFEYAEADTGPSHTWYLGTDHRASYRTKDTGHYAHLTVDASYVTSDGLSRAGSLSFYFDVDDVDISDNYYPDLKLFRDFGDAASGYITDIYEFNNLSGSLLNLTQEERDWIVAHKKIQIGVDPSAMPYEAIDTDGSYTGIINDYLQIIGQKAGISISAVPVESWRETMKLADHSQVELVSAAVENQTLQENYHAADGLFSSRLSVASKKELSNVDLSKLAGWEIGILNYASNTNDIIERFPNIKWKRMESAQEGLESVDEDRIDAFVDTVHVLNYLINTQGYRDISIVGRFDVAVTPTLHVLKTEPELFSIINKIIRSISTNEHRRIEAKWSAPKQIEKVDYTLVYTISGFSLLVLILIVVWNRQLNKQVGIANKAREDLVTAQNDLYAILNTSPIAASVVVNDRVVYLNQTATSLFKLEELSVDDFDVNRIYHSSDVRKEVYEQLLLNGSVINKEMTLLKADGEEFTGLVSYYRFTLGDRMSTLFWAFDISEQKRLQQDLESEKLRADAASKAKSEFLANMSHEIRTPMNAIIGLSHLAIGEKDDTVAQNYITKVHRSGLSLLNIINDILDFSKIEAGQLVVEHTPFQLTEPLKEVIDLLQVKADEKGLILQTAWESDINNILVGDPLRLFQVTLNLVGNAIKFTQSGSVTLKAEALESRPGHFNFRVSVIDTGIGIPSEKLAGLFEAFSQADSSTTRRFGGTGLGLNISQKLVSAMGGTISVSSEEGAGSEFSYLLELPLATPEQITQFHQAQINESGEVLFSGEQILLVEDNEMNQELAMAVLDKLNLTAELAENGQEAVEMVARNDYALILMDIQMPVMDGIEATQKIRQSENQVPVIAMSANVFSDVKQAAMSAGMNDFVDKPIRIEQLVKTISQYIGPSSSGRSPNRAATKVQEADSAPVVYSKQAASQYANNDSKLEDKLRNQFIDKALTIFDEVTALLKENRYPEAELKIHTLKSMSATIGGQKLASVLQQAEKKAHEKILVKQELTDIDCALKELLEALPDNEPANLADAIPEAGVNAEQLSQLKQQIESFDMKALSMVAEMMEESGGANSVLTAVHKALEQYDFEQALKEVQLLSD